MSELFSTSELFDQALTAHQEVIRSLSQQKPLLERIASEMTAAIFAGRKVLWCGNGGSAADAQHLAAELVCRFRRERRGLASIALTTDTSILTAIGNDYGYQHVFRRQIDALCVKGDVVVGLSTSGNSENVCAAIDAARKMGALTVTFTGESGGNMAHLADIAFRIKSSETGRIQEAYMLCGHFLCDWIELCVYESEAAARH